MNIRCQHNGLAAVLILLPALFTSPVVAGDVISGGRIVHTPQQLNRSATTTYSDGGVRATTPNIKQERIYQRQEYGQPVRTGTRISGASGSIILWSAPSAGLYQAPAPKQQGYKQKFKAVPLTGPKLQYKPGYGKPPDRNN